MYSTSECHFCGTKKFLNTSAFEFCDNCKYDYRCWDDNVITFMFNNKQYNCCLQSKIIVVNILKDHSYLELGWILINQDNIQEIDAKIEKLKLFI